MKRTLLFLFALTCTVAVRGQATGVSVEVVETHTGVVGDADLTGFTTYRVYLDLTDSADFVTSMYGLGDTPWLISTTGVFYQDMANGAASSHLIGNDYEANPQLEFDSWIAIGKESFFSPGSQSVSILEPSNAVELFESGEDLFVTDGSIYTINTSDNINAVAGDDLRVLLGQFTTDGVLSGCLNTQVQLLGQAGQQFSSNDSFPFSSDPDAVFGCIDPEATNYDENATSTDCSCIFPCSLQLTNIEVSANNCPGDESAVIEAESSGGQGIVSYELDGDSNVTGIFNGLAEGEYTISISDSEGCTADTTITIEDPEPLAFDAEVTQISCFGLTDGSITATTTGGSGEILYSLDDATNITDTENVYSGLSEDTYTIYAEDECTTISQEVAIVEPTELTITVNNVIDVSCFGAMDGEIDVIAEGGTPEYTFSEVNNLGPGNYTVTATDANGCTATSSEVTITEPAEINLTAEVTPVSCAGDTNGVVVLSTEGGAGNFTYSFDGSAFEAASEFMNLQAGVYEAAALDQNDCSVSMTVEVTEPDPIVLDVTTEDVSCNGDIDGSFTISTTGGNGDFEYYINGEGPTTETEFENQEPTVYEIMVEDAEGCSADTSITISEPDELVISNSDITIDSGAGDGEISIDVDGGTEDYTYEWTGPDGFTSDEEDIDGLIAGEYTVTITDANGCTVTETFNVLVGIEELFNNVEVSLMPNPSEGEFYLELGGLEGEEIAYKVVDMHGRVILDEKIEWKAAEVREMIDITNQSSGLYYLMIQIGDERGTLKMMKQN